MVIQVRIEPTSPAYQAGALPLSYWTVDWHPSEESNPDLRVWKPMPVLRATEVWYSGTDSNRHLEIEGLGSCR